jgi:large subunit ribosomal protein L53
MITRFITEVKTRFNPFSPRARSARLFLSFLPPTARSSGMNISAQLLPRTSAEPSTLEIKFSMCHPPNTYACLFLLVGWF